jgi:hypothetical protein
VAVEIMMQAAALPDALGLAEAEATPAYMLDFPLGWLSPNRI